MARIAPIRSAAVCLAAALLTVCTATMGAASKESNEDEDEILGASAIAPDSVRQVVQRLGSYCASFDPALQPVGDNALKVWEERHQRYLDESALIRAKFQEAANAPGVSPQTKKNIRNLFEVELPKMVTAQFEGISAPIKALTTREAKSTRCREYFQYIVNGKLDITVNNPKLARYLEGRMIATAKKNTKK